MFLIKDDQEIHHTSGVQACRCCHFWTMHADKVDHNIAHLVRVEHVAQKPCTTSRCTYVSEPKRDDVRNVAVSVCTFAAVILAVIFLPKLAAFVIVTATDIFVEIGLALLSLKKLMIVLMLIS